MVSLHQELLKVLEHCTRAALSGGVSRPGCQLSPHCRAQRSPRRRTRLLPSAETPNFRFTRKMRRQVPRKRGESPPSREAQRLLWGKSLVSLGWIPENPRLGIPSFLGGKSPFSFLSMNKWNQISQRRYSRQQGGELNALWIRLGLRFHGFPSGSVGKESARSAGDPGSIPGRKDPWRRQWHLTPVLLPGESHGWRSLMGCRLWGCTESDTTEAT